MHSHSQNGKCFKVITDLPTWQGLLSTSIAKQKLQGKENGTYFIYDHSKTQQAASSFVFYIGLLDRQNIFQEIRCLYSQNNQNLSASIEFEAGSSFISNKTIEELLEDIAAATFSLELRPYSIPTAEFTYEEIEAPLFQEERLDIETDRTPILNGRNRPSECHKLSSQRPFRVPNDIFMRI